MNVYSSKKPKKICSEQNFNGDMFSIDNLPDAVIEHILSFLPTKDAFRATVPSKRWRNLWRSLPSLDFHERAPERRSIFMNFVDKVIEIHDSSSIRDFSLKCNVLSDASRISKWITHAASHKPERLCLWLKKVQEPLIIPPCLLTCKTLVSLSLYMHYDLKLPSDICFLSLKTLKLRNLIFSDDHSTQALFSSCPVLEELETVNCTWGNVNAICICLPMLRELTMEDDIDIDDYSDDEDDVKDNHNDFHCCQFVIFGTKLESFSFCGQVRYEYCLFNASSLVDATLNLRRTQSEIRPDRTNDYAFHVHKLLRALSNVEGLTLSKDVFEAVEHAKELFATLPVFPNLTYLEFTRAQLDISCKGLVTILQNMAYLEIIEFSYGITLWSSGKDESIFDPIPPCFSTHLKTIKIGGFTGADHEIKAVGILLKHATCLKNMIIDFLCFDLSGDANKLKEVQKKLLLHPKGSANCKLAFWNKP